MGAEGDRSGGLFCVPGTAAAGRFRLLNCHNGSGGFAVCEFVLVETFVCTFI